MAATTKILVSVSSDGKLDQRQIHLKGAINRALKREGFDLQEFGKAGIPRRLPWSYENVQSVLRRCQGAIVIAFNVGNYAYRNGATVGVITEYNHIEGTLALAQSLPMFVISEDTNSQRGILTSAFNHYSVIPSTSASRWVLTNAFKSDVKAWSDEVRARYHVFLGYSSGARSTASEVKSFLTRMDVRVLDWMINFRSGGTVLDEIQHAEKTCMGGIFLFTKDDEITSRGEKKAAPRDNVIFEAGYFMNTKGKERTLLICEEGVKIPADVGGNIYLSLKDRHDISTIEGALRRFIEDRF